MVLNEAAGWYHHQLCAVSLSSRAIGKQALRSRCLVRLGDIGVLLLLLLLLVLEDGSV